MAIRMGVSAVYQGSVRKVRRTTRDVEATVVASLVAGAVLIAIHGQSIGANIVALFAGLMVPTIAAASLLRRRPPNSTWADLVTLVRAVLVGGCTTVVVLSLFGNLELRSWPLFLMALPAFLLDGVDGWVARSTGTASADGGRLDMETDAVMLLVLSIPLTLTLGPWVLGIGAMRYLFVAAARWRPTLGYPLAFSSFRRTTAGIQGGALVAAVNPAVPVSVASVVTLVALALLTVSFGRDIVTLEREQRGRTLETMPRDREG